MKIPPGHVRFVLVGLMLTQTSTLRRGFEWTSCGWRYVVERDRAFSGRVGAVAERFVGQKKIHCGDWRALRVSLVLAMLACASLPLLCTNPSIASVRDYRSPAQRALFFGPGDLGQRRPRLPPISPKRLPNTSPANRWLNPASNVLAMAKARASVQPLCLNSGQMLT